MKHIIIFNHDIQKYPPILSAIEILLSLNQKVEVIGYSSSQERIKELQNKGVVYHEAIINKLNDSKLIKLIKLVRYKKRVKNIVNEKFDKDSTLWIYGNENIWLLHKLVYQYKTILYLFEMPILNVSLKYKILSMTLNYKKVMQKGWAVVCCEYNRSHITKAFFNLSNLPTTIPNKPAFSILNLKPLDQSIESIFLNKKVVLYQGIFNYPERRLEELCESIKYLPSDFIICVMGGDDFNKERLQKKYESDRVVFLPFVAAPNHLEITRRAHIGFLSYFSLEGTIENCLNTLYCAPNKIYEYSCFSIPMIANDVPALALSFEKFKAGKIVSDFTPQGIAIAILEIENNYNNFKKGSKELHDFTDVKDIYKKLINPN